MSIFVPYLVSNYYGETVFERILIFFLLIIIFHLVFEFGVRFFDKIRNIKKKNYFIEDLFVEPHPNLPYVYKKNNNGPKSKIWNYPIHPNTKLPALKSNNLRCFNGSKGNRDIQIPKPKNLIRINCIGASTTENYIEKDGQVYSYPLELEKNLKKRSINRLEVNNFGFGGYNSNDLLVRFNLQILDTCPDYLVILHGYNDIKSYLTPNFSSDYFHSRKNLAESYWKLIISSKLSKLPFQYIKVLLESWIPNFSIVNNLIDIVSKGSFNIEDDPTLGLKTYKRNIKCIIDTCLNNKIKVVLTTYSFYLYDKIKNDKLQKVYKKIVNQENKIIKDLANYYNIPLVDADSIIPKDDSFFVDSIHFTPKGMTLLADSISKKININ